MREGTQAPSLQQPLGSVDSYQFFVGFSRRMELLYTALEPAGLVKMSPDVGWALRTRSRE